MAKINVVNQSGAAAAPAQAPQEQDIDLAFLFAHIRRNRWLLILTTLLGLLLGALYYFTAEREYTAETTLMIDLDSEAAASQMSEVADMLGGKGQPEALAPAYAIATSRTLAARVVEELDLVDDPEFNPALREPGAKAAIRDAILPVVASVREALGAAPVEEEVGETPEWATEEALARRYAVETLANRIVARQLNDDLRLSIAVQTDDPGKSAAILDTVVVELNAMMSNSKAMALGNARDWIDGEAGRVEERLREIEDQINSEISAGSVMPGTERLSENAERLVQGELILESNRRKTTALTRLREVLARIEGGERAASAFDSLPADMRTELALDYPAIFALADRAREPASGEIEAAIRQVDTELERQVTTTTQREREIRPIRDYTRQLSTAQNRYLQLSTTYDTNAELLKTLRSRRAELQIELAGESEKLTVLETAQPPLRHSSPSLPFSLAAGALIGLILATALMVLRSLRRNAFVSLDEVEATYDAPAIGIVPEFRSRFSKKFAWAALPHETQEAYRRAYAAFFVMPEHQKPGALMISSCIPGEGKTTTSVYVAAAAAEEGRRTLVVDLDFRKRSVSRYLKIASELGVYNVFRGEHSIEQCVVPYDRDGVSFDVLTSDGRHGSKSGDRRETLTAGGVRAMVEAAMEAGYEVIVLDAPPVLAVQDSAIIGQAAEHVLCVVSTRDIKKRVARRAITEWKRAGISIDGLLVRGEKAELYEYYGYDYYHYGYAAKEEGRARRSIQNRRRRGGGGQRPRPESRPPEPQRIPEAGE